MEENTLMDTFCNLYTEIYINNKSHSDELFDFVNQINCENLDYTKESNVFLLFYKILINKAYYYFNIENELNILQKQSSILYHAAIQSFSVKSETFINDAICNSDAIFQIEKVVQMFKKYLLELKTCFDEKEKEQIQQLYTQSVDKIIPNNEVYKLIVLHLLNIEEFNFEIEPAKNNVRTLLCYVNHFINSYNFEKLQYYLEFLKQTKISKHFVTYIENLKHICCDKNFDIDPMELTKCLEQLFNYDEKKMDDFSLGKLGAILTKVSFMLLRVPKQSVHRQKYQQHLQNFLDSKLHFIPNDDCSDVINNMFRNYYGFKVANAQSQTESNDYLQKLRILLELLLEKSNSRENIIVDLMSVLNNLKEYNTVLEIYYKYKSILTNKMKNSSLHFKLFTVLCPALIFTHKVQTAKEFFNVIPNIHSSCEFINNTVALFEKYKKCIIQNEEIVTTFGFNIIEEYDYEQDVKGFKNSDDKIVCPICIEPIEEERITVIECKFCHKYVGHMLCVSSFIMRKIKTREKVKCIICQHEYPSPQTSNIQDMQNVFF